jgi:hypothetical protein
MQNTVAKKESVKGRLTRSDNFFINSSSLAFGHSWSAPSHRSKMLRQSIRGHHLAPPSRKALASARHADVVNAVILWAIEQNALIHSAIFARISFVSRIGLFDFSPFPQGEAYFFAVRGLADHI